MNKDTTQKQYKRCHMLIDPPVSAYHSENEIKGWLEDLYKKDTDCEEVQWCIEQAKKWLNLRHE